jgi:hypothetical protein
MAQKSSSSPSRASKEFNFMSFVWRLAATLTLVLLTYNPSDFSYIGWLQSTQASETASLGPEHFVVGIVIVIGWVILLTATQRSLGTLGLVLGGLLLGGIVWLLIDVDVLSMGSVSAVTWVVLVCLAVLLAIGLSWSHVWRRLTGQFEVDDGE